MAVATGVIDVTDEGSVRAFFNTAGSLDHLGACLALLTRRACGCPRRTCGNRGVASRLMRVRGRSCRRCGERRCAGMSPGWCRAPGGSGAAVSRRWRSQTAGL